ncbi:NADH:flavin oxidoreductase [Leifsonia rubra CMS 76R]|nr:NADH:flavin oxidoreductase [Leifsonia rubra CMS 76R]
MQHPQSQLFQPITINGLTVPHRLWVAPMCMYSSVDGQPGDWHIAHYGSFAIGRAGLIMTEATAVSPEGRISPDDAGLWNDEHTKGWRRVVEVVHGMNSLIGMQLSHAGRKASTAPPTRGRGYVPPAEGGWVTVGPTDLPYEPFAAPVALDHDGIAKVIKNFRDAACRAVEAGFDLVEVHAAHGYLLGQFLSPTSNTRTDEYGKDNAGRTRLLREVVEAVREVIPTEMPLVVRLSATEWVVGGVTVDDTIEVIRGLVGVDLISVSSGGNSPGQHIVPGPGYQQPLSRKIRAEVDIPVGVAGLITSPQQAEAAIVTGDTDIVFAARQFLREPNFALRAAAELGGELEWVWQYNRAKYWNSIP